MDFKKLKESQHIEFKASLKQGFEPLDTNLLEKFIEKINSTGRININDDLLTNLTKLKLIHQGSPTLAAMLLFGNHGYSIHIGRFKVEDTIIDDQFIKEPLITALEETMMFIKKHINLSYHFDGSLKRKERWQYPLDAVRELLLNSVVHRDYKHTNDIVIKIFDDKIIFTNPGTIYGSLKLEDLKKDDYVSSIRNKLLAEAFYLMGDIEKYGTGFIRIRRLLKQYPEIEYEIDEIGDFFRVTMFTKDLKNDPINTNGLTENQIKILAAIRNNKKITQQKLSQNIGITAKNISLNIKKLKEKGLLKRIGSLKSGYWELFLES
ncbi:ATP-binding protein [Desulfobacterales bacterium HSG17]|nr:ATP-binding protein [Desulfobacterales bacterium HSG17]